MIGCSSAATAYWSPSDAPPYRSRSTPLKPRSCRRRHGPPFVRHAPHASDAGAILSLASQTLWAAPAATLTSLGVALVDTTAGNTSVALAGDCLAWRVRAATCERLAIHQPPVGTASTFNYLSQSFQLALRERLILVADDSFRRSPKAELALTARFSHLDAESHRRMAAADAVALVRKVCDTCDCEPTQSTSIAAVRRR